MLFPTSTIAMTSLRVAIVEEDGQLRDAMVRILEGAGDMTCVAAFATAEEAIAVFPQAAPDVVLMDINLPGITGIEGTRRLRATMASGEIVMLTAFDDTERVFESLQAGASGYVLKRAPAAEILDAVREVLRALSEGQFYKEFADTLGISINTVRSHVKSIYDKLRVSSRHEAVNTFARL